MNLLIDRPPETVKIGDTDYEINSDFRISVLFELLMQDDDVPDSRKVARAFELYFPEFPSDEDPVEIFKAIAWFYRCGRGDKEQKSERSGEGNEVRPRSYSFDYDDEYIYAAFRQQYGIDLVGIDYLHWWEFRAMFKALDEKCAFVKIMGYRTTKITSEMSNTEKAFLRRMKRIHALPVSEAELRQTNALEEALMNGGDLTGLLGFEEADDG